MKSPIPKNWTPEVVGEEAARNEQTSEDCPYRKRSAFDSRSCNRSHVQYIQGSVFPANYNESLANVLDWKATLIRILVVIVGAGAVWYAVKDLS